MLQMAKLLQVVKDKARSVKEEVTWANIKKQLTADKIIIVSIIIFLWGFSSIPLFIFYSTPSGAKDNQVSRVLFAASRT